MFLLQCQRPSFTRWITLHSVTNMSAVKPFYLLPLGYWSIRHTWFTIYRVAEPCLLIFNKKFRTRGLPLTLTSVLPTNPACAFHAFPICMVSSSSSSSSSSPPPSYCPSAANAPNVLQPYWLIVLPLDFPDLTASLLL